MVDAHGLLLELQPELEELTNPMNTHIGIGFAFTKEQVRVVELVGRKLFYIDTLNKAPTGEIEACGRLIDPKVGLYAARIQKLAEATRTEKQIAMIGPQDIELNKDTGEFRIVFPKDERAQSKFADIETAFQHDKEPEPRVF